MSASKKIKHCEVCGCQVTKSVMQTPVVCSDECKKIRKSNLPKKLSIVSLQYWINCGYSIDDAKAEVIKQQRLRSKRCVEYWINHGYSHEDAVSEVAAVQSANGKRYASAYSEEDRRKKSSFCVEYWINLGLDLDSATKLISERSDTVSLKSYINRHGEDEGTRLYEEQCAHRQNHYSLEGYIDKHGLEQGTIMWNKKFQHRPNSKSADSFFVKLLTILTPTPKIYSAITEHGEYGLNDSSNGKYYFYDFVIPEYKLCIEYHGDYWHCNPIKYLAKFYHPHKKMTATEIWLADSIKIDCLKTQRGYDTLIVWESDDENTKLNQIMEKINELKNSKN
jgi:G:T-mismatch repair DNA endonuclease (very short patch repair protein)/predicted nucleic acid-binding Zn ribbon protein